MAGEMMQGRVKEVKERENRMTRRHFEDTKKRGGINRRGASGRKHCQKSERDLFNVKKIHNACCIMPGASCKIQLQPSYSDRQ